MTNIEAGQKGFPLIQGIAGIRNLFDERSAFPVAVLLQSALKRNSSTMMDFCRDAGISLAPHGKTTMSPQLMQMQMRDGAWAITAANVYQAKVMKESGVPRVLIANEVTAPGDIAWLAEQVATGFDVMCYVDSMTGIQLLHDGLVAGAQGKRLNVLIELGVVGGRTGTRSVDEAIQIARAVSSTSTLRIVGVAGFEGIIESADDATAEERVDLFLNKLAALATSVIDERLNPDLHEFIVSAGGSVFFDRVVTALTRIRSSIPIRVVVRSGCYLSHDDGVINERSPLGAHPRVSGSTFDSALEVWAPVLSRPEPSRLILGAGKRDLSTDSLFPVAKKWVRRGTREVREFVGHPRAIKVDDQHTYLDVELSCEVDIGDYVGLGISHPCTTFDKWRAIPVVSDDYDVIDVVTTRF